MPDTYLWDVFLSHSSRDKSRVRQLAERLHAVGLRVWFDEWVIKPGDDMYAAIEHGLEYARTLILCMSQAAFRSDWTSLERNTVIFRNPQNTDRRFIPLLLEDCPIPDVIRRYSYVDWRDESDTALQRLVNVCPLPAPAEIVNQPVAPQNIAPPGGAILHSDPLYIARAADAEVVAAAQRTTATLIIKGPRQFGKSSILKHYLAACQDAQKRTVLLDLARYTAEELATYPTQSAGT
jgi:TIR domain/AAA-like domain